MFGDRHYMAGRTPEAITAASHKDERPSRSTATIASALSSSSEATIRFSNSLCGGALRGLGATFLTFGLVDFWAKP